MTKKWKWPSMAPFIRCTTTADEVSSPTQTATARLRREKRRCAATTAQSAIGPASTAACHSGWPASSPQAKSAIACAQTRPSIQAWRRSHTAGGRVRPLGRARPRRENALTTRWSALHRVSLCAARPGWTCRYHPRRRTRESSGRRLVTRSASRCSRCAWANLREV